MNPYSEFQTYRFRVVLYGSVSSPFMLYAAIHYHLSRHPSSVADDMQSNLYVDNVISGGNSEEVVSYYKKSRALMSQANFNLHLWASNSIQLQNLTKQDGTAETSNIVKVLGLQWNTSSDQLSLTQGTSPPLHHSSLNVMSCETLPVFLIHLGSSHLSPFKPRFSYRNCGERTYNEINR